MLNFFIHSSGVYRWSCCPQLRVYAGVWPLAARLTKVDFIYHVKEYFPKSLGFLERWILSTCYPVEGRGGTSSKKNNKQFFSLRTPTRVVWSKVEEKLKSTCFLGFRGKFFTATLASWTMHWVWAMTDCILSLKANVQNHNQSQVGDSVEPE